MNLREFLNKETPSYGGCMVCIATYYKEDFSTTEKKVVTKERTIYLLVERHECANGDIFTINSRPYYDYDFVWNDRVKDWEVIYKKEN